MEPEGRHPRDENRNLGKEEGPGRGAPEGSFGVKGRWRDDGRSGDPLVDPLSDLPKGLQPPEGGFVTESPDKLNINEKDSKINFIIIT